MAKISTKKEILQLLAESTKRTPTAEEIERQRISFIIANLSKDSTVTREQIERVLREGQGKIAS